MPLNLFYTMVQKKSKMTKNSNQGGSCLKVSRQKLKNLRQGFVDLPFFFHSAKTVSVYRN